MFELDAGICGRELPDNRRAALILTDGTEASFRWTAVFRQEGGEWKMIQGHASIGVAN